MEQFIKATKKKLRFTTSKGELSTEQLWDLSLESLDLVAKAVNKSLKASEEESFIGKKTVSSSDDNLRLDILKEIIKIKLEEKERRAKRQEVAEQLIRLKELAAQKQTEAFGQQSLEDIQKQIEALSKMNEDN